MKAPWASNPWVWVLSFRRVQEGETWGGKETPILFRGEMVRAILEARKTQTRRVLSPGRGQKWITAEALEKVRRWEHRKDGWWAMAVGEPRRIVHCGVEMDGGHIGSVLCPYGKPGDRLWVRETVALDYFSSTPYLEPSARHGYRADWSARAADSIPEPRWTPSIHMPRWACRLVLQLTDIQVERLQDISEEDAKAEGAAFFDGRPVNHHGWRHDDGAVYATARESFRSLWQSIHG